MNSLDLLLFIIVGIGITNLIVNATILDNLRLLVTDESEFLGKLISCMMCSGFWVGFIISFGFNISPIYGGAIISLFSQISGTLIDYLDLKIVVLSESITDEDEEDE